MENFFYFIFNNLIFIIFIIFILRFFQKGNGLGKISGEGINNFLKKIEKFNESDNEENISEENSSHIKSIGREEKNNISISTRESYVKYEEQISPGIKILIVIVISIILYFIISGIFK